MSDNSDNSNLCGTIDVSTAGVDEHRWRVSSSVHPKDPALVEIWGGGRETAAGEDVDERSALAFAAVYAAVRVLAETIASIPVMVYKRLPGGGKEPAPDHPAYRVLHDEANEETSAVIWRETLQGHLGTYGNAYAEIQRTRRGSIAALWQLAPDRVTPKRENKKLFYEYTSPEGGRQTLPPERVFHVPGLGFDGLVGYSPIGLMRESIGLGLGAQRFASETFANDGRPSGTLEHPGTLSDPAQERWKKAADKRAAHGGRHKLLILEEGMKFAATGMKPEDVQMILTRRFQVEDVARAYRIAPHLLQDLTHGTFSNIEELGREFITFTMLPWFRRWEAEFNRKVIRDPKYFAEFNIEGFLRGDVQKRYAAYAIGRQWGFLSANDIRQRENWNPIEGGDVYLSPLNMVPVDKIDDLYTGGGDKPAAGGDDARLLPQSTGEMDRVLRVQTQRIAGQLSGLFDDAAGRAMRREVNVVRSAAKKHIERGDLEGFRAWMEQFYAGHQAYVRDAWQPAIDSLVQIAGQAVGGVDAARLAEVALPLAEDLAARHVGRSLAELRPLEFAKDIDSRLDQWETERATAAGDVARFTQNILRELYAAADMAPPKLDGENQ